MIDRIARAASTNAIAVSQSAMAKAALAQTAATDWLGATPYATWSELSAVTGAAGGKAVVIDDAGTHTDPVTGTAGVKNAGFYVWSASPAGWRRVADTQEAKAQGWAEGTLPGGAGTKSAKEWAEQASVTGADFQAKRGQITVESMRIDYNTLGTASRGLDERVTYAAGSDVRWDAKGVTPAAYPDGITITIPIVSSGTGFTTATVTEQTAAGVQTVAAVNMTVQTDRATLTINALNASTAQLRIRLVGPSGAIVYPPIVHAPTDEPVFEQNYQDSNSLSAVENYVKVAAEVPNIRNIYNLSTTTGSASTQAGYIITVPNGSRTLFRVNVSGLVTATDRLQIVLKASQRLVSSLGATIAGITGFAHSGVSGGAAASSATRYLGAGLYVLDLDPAEAAAGADPAYIEIVLDNRSGASPATVELLYAGVGSSLPTYLQAPGAVYQALSDAGVSVAYIDASSGSDDTGTGSISLPYATASRAVAAGSRRLLLRAGQTHRASAGLSFSDMAGVEFSCWRKAGDTASQARIAGATNYPAASWELDGTYTNLYKLAFAVDPGAVWEVVDGIETRMGEVYVDAGWQGAARKNPSLSLSDANAAQGAYIYSGGFLYIHPYDGVIAGKSYEVPTTTVLLALTRASAVLRSVIFQYARSYVLSANGCDVLAAQCDFASTSTDDAVNVAVCNWSGRDNRYYDAGDDGFGTQGWMRQLEIGSRYFDNRGDGWAPHGQGTDGNDRAIYTLIGCKALDNAKLGFCSIAQADHYLIGCEGIGNYREDCYIQPNDVYGSVATNVEISDCRFDATWLCKGAPDYTCSIKGLTGKSITINGAISFTRFEGINLSGSSLHGLWGVGASFAVTDFKIRQAASNGVRADNSTITLTDGHILRNATGAAVVSGGSILFSATNPVNVFGNTTQFSSVDAGEQAKTASFNAI